MLGEGAIIFRKLDVINVECDKCAAGSIVPLA